VNPRLPPARAAVAALGLLLLGSAPAAQSPVPAPPPAAAFNPEISGLLDRLEAAWSGRDLAAYRALWTATPPDELQEEMDIAASRFASEELRFQLQRPSAVAGAASKVGVSAEVFSSSEPRGRVEQWRFQLEKHDGVWRLAGREDLSAIDGLVHLSLSPDGFRADGLTLKLEDFELAMHQGSLFTSPPSLGPTVLVFVGEATVRVSPRPPAEREQLRQFCGKPEMVDKVRVAFIRIHPGDLYHVLVPARLDPDPGAAARLPEAQRVYRENAQRFFMLDAALPRSPWWLLPSLGDASVTFEAGRKGRLTFTVSSSEPEDVSFFDREHRLQICLYPSGGRSTRYSEDDGRTADVVEHDLQVRFDPARFRIDGQDTLKLRLFSAVSTLRLRLDDGLRVESVTSKEGGQHLFFRVRDQGTVMVSLGPLTGTVGELSLTIKYSGSLNPAPIDQEVLQLGRTIEAPSPVDEIFLEPILVYTNRSAWYPRGTNDDYARARLRFDVPLGASVVTGGQRVSARVEGSRTFVEYRLDEPGKYLTAAIGRLQEAGSLTEGSVRLAAFGTSRTRDEATESLKPTAEILRFYTEVFGPCPYPFLNLVVAEGETPGGHSPPGMVFLQRRPPLMRRALRDDPANFTDIPGFFLAHELAHQWWGQGVAGQNYRERWLSEAFAQYAAALWIRKSRGEEACQGILERLGRWAFRYTAQGPINLGHRLGYLKSDPQIYRAIVYDKGACVLHMLRALVGDSAFTRGLRSFQNARRFAKAGTDDLRETLEAESGQDLGPYFREWVEGTALPVLHYAHRSEPQGSGFRTTIDVRASGLPGPVPILVTLHTDRGPDTRTLTLAPEGGTLVVDTAGRPRKVELNADRALLAKIEH
jgi:hypothetical protein